MSNLPNSNYYFSIKNYHELMLSQYNTISNGGLNLYQQQALTIAKQQIQLCLIQLQKNSYDVVELTEEELMIANFTKCYEHLFRNEFLSLQICDQQLQLSCDGNFGVFCELRAYYQLFYLGNFTLARSTFLSQETSLQFIFDLLEGKLSHWKLISSDPPATKLLTNSPGLMKKSVENSMLLKVHSFELQQRLQRLNAFIHVYSTASSRTSLSAHPFADLIQKLSHQVKRIQQLVSDEQFETFLTQEYEPFYGKTMILSYLTLGLPREAVNYYLSLYDSIFLHDLDTMKDIALPWSCEQFFHYFFPHYSIATELSCLFHCQQFDSLMNDESSLVRLSYQLWRLLFTRDQNTSLIINHERIRWLYQDSSRLIQYFLLISQIMNPVILSDIQTHSSRPAISLEENMYLRFFFIKILQVFDTFCIMAKEHDHNNQDDWILCERMMSEETITSIVRGFFLQAYSGVNLLSQFYQKFLLPTFTSDSNLNFTDTLRDEMLPCLRDVFPKVVLPLLDDPTAVSTFLRFSPLNNSQSLVSDSDSPVESAAIPVPKIVKIGILSYSLSRHSVGRLFAKIIAYLATPTHHRSENVIFDVYIFTNRPHSQQSPPLSPFEQGDDITTFLESIIPPDHWIALGNTLSIFHPQRIEMITRIQQLALQVLIYTDILMQSTQYLFAYSYRFAKYQLLFWGHPYTSSNPLIDYYITSSTFEAEHPLFLRNNQFTEQLVYFDSLSFLLYPPAVNDASLFTSNHLPFPQLEETTSVETIFEILLQKREKFLSQLLTTATTIEGNRLVDYIFNTLHQVSQEGNVDNNQSEVLTRYLSTFSWSYPKELQNLTKIHIYATLQSLMKMHPFFDHVIIRLLLADPYAVILLLMHSKQYHWFRSFQKRLFTLAIDYSVPLSILQTRILWLPSMPHQQYAEMICKVDVVLDPFPFGGGVTMCDAIAGPCRDRSIQSFLERNHHSKSYESVPYVTVQNLQSIHAIGVGIAKRVNNTQLASWIDDRVMNVSHAIHQFHQIQTQTIHRFKTMTIHNLFHSYSDAIIDAYVHEAITMANQSLQQRFTPTRVPYETVQTVENQTNPHELVYQQVDTLLEWQRFLVKLSL